MKGERRLAKLFHVARRNMLRGVESGATCVLGCSGFGSAHIWVLEAVYKCRLRTVLVAQAVHYNMEALQHPTWELLCLVTSRGEKTSLQTGTDL